MKLLQEPWTPAPDLSVQEWTISPGFNAGGALSIALSGKVPSSPWPNHPHPAFVGLLGLYRDRVLVAGLQVQCKRNRLQLDLGNAEGIKHADGVLVRGDQNTFITGQPFRIALTLKDGGTASINVPGAESTAMPQRLSGGKLMLRLGMEGIADGAYFPPIGWTFEDLDVEDGSSAPDEPDEPSLADRVTRLEQEVRELRALITPSPP